MMLSTRTLLPVLVLIATLSQTQAQTYSKCNPLTQGGCAADPALGGSRDISFTSASSDFTASGNVDYGSNGAEFTVAESGDAPTITSNWYIMFGHVEYTIQAAPGTGIVSSAVMQSDCLDEIDWEWLGGDDTQVQSNYFGKGLTTTYNRGAFHSADSNHDEFHTYTIDWTAAQIVWQVDGQTVRVLTQSDAASGQYPQTPMQIKVGSWAGGAPSNAPGTIQWAGGPCDFSAGPFTMYLKELAVTDYSTGKQYSYSGTAGTWQSITSSGGQINSDGSGSDTPSNTASAPAVTSAASGSAPLAFGNSGSTSPETTATSTFPWYGSATASVVTTTCTSIPSGLPSGWTVGSDCKVSPPSSGVMPSPSISSPPVSSPASSSPLASGLELSTSWDSRGFPTVVTVNPAAPTQPKSYDSQGFLITSTTPASAPSTSVAPAAVPSTTAASGLTPASTIPASSAGSLTPSTSGTLPPAASSAASYVATSASEVSSPVALSGSPSASTPTSSAPLSSTSGSSLLSTGTTETVSSSSAHPSTLTTFGTLVTTSTSRVATSASASPSTGGTPAAVAANVGARHGMVAVWVAIGALLV